MLVKVEVKKYSVSPFKINLKYYIVYHNCKCLDTPLFRHTKIHMSYLHLGTL